MEEVKGRTGLFNTGNFIWVSKSFCSESLRRDALYYSKNIGANFWTFPLNIEKDGVA